MNTSRTGWEGGLGSSEIRSPTSIVRVEEVPLETEVELDEVPEETVPFWLESSPPHPAIASEKIVRMRIGIVAATGANARPNTTRRAAPRVSPAIPPWPADNARLRECPVKCKAHQDPAQQQPQSEYEERT